MILETLTVAGGLLLFLILFRVPVCRRTAGPAPVLRLSILIPARNEEAALPRLLDSIRRQDFRPFEVVVVDDGSTDRTAAVAVERGAVVLTSAPLPEGWRGKTWACWQGARAARGDVFLFLDADTFFFEGGLRRLVDSWRAGGGAVSAGPYQVMERPYERLSAFFALVMTAAMGAFTVAGRRVKGAGLFGPCLMVERAAYFRSGGHEGQKGRILENFFMAARFAEIGVPVRCFGGRECLGVRLYPGGWRELAAGWTKAFAAGAGQTAPWLLAVIVAWLSAAMLAALLPVLRLVTAGPGAAAWAAGACLWFAIIIRWALGRIGNYGWPAAFLFPVPLLFFMVVFSRSLFRQLTGRSVQWKGRTIVAGKEDGQ
jgi:4,4'-diaponeurosporenoate glycosyltransferase